MFYLLQVLFFLLGTLVIKINDFATFLSINSHLKMLIIAWSLSFFIMDIVISKKNERKCENNENFDIVILD